MTLDSNKYPLLGLVEEPAQLRDLAQDKLPAFSDELRDYLLNSVSQSSGHLASGLGTVELTVALHYVYNTPDDRLVWDVGHQAYPHKILTGRRDQMHTIRQKEGLHPFPIAVKVNMTPLALVIQVHRFQQPLVCQSQHKKRGKVVKPLL
jgi:1-deoxy-D-xylulose-5-phosphate synthase